MKHVMRATAQVQHQRPGTKTTDVSTCGNLLLICASTDHQRQAVQIWTVLRSLQVEPVMHGMNGTHKRQKFSSWFHCKAWSMHM